MSSWPYWPCAPAASGGGGGAPAPPYYADARLELEAEDFGIGYGTLTGLRRVWLLGEHVDLIADHAGEEAPAELTPLGHGALAAILELDGVEALA